MKSPKNEKKIVRQKTFDITELQSNRFFNEKIIRKKVFKHAVNKLMDAFIHLIRETELNLKIYRTLNHERVLLHHKGRNFRANQSSLN